MKYTPDIAASAHALALLGAKDREIAVELGVPIETFELWKACVPDVKEALQRGRAVADGRVAAALYERAIGYQHPEEKIFVQYGEVTRVETIKRYPPDTKAALAWLSRRRPEDWMERTVQEHTGKIQFETAMRDLYGDDAKLIEGEYKDAAE